MYYKTFPLGTARFLLSEDKEVLKIDTLYIDSNKVADTLLTNIEVARALILESYYLNKDTLQEVALRFYLVDKDNLLNPGDDFPAHQALESLVDEGYVGYLEGTTEPVLQEGFYYYKFEPTIMDATWTISSIGAPGNIDVSGTETAPTLKVGDDTLIDGGTLAPNIRGFNIKGDKLKFLMEGDYEWILEIDTVLTQALEGFSVESIQFALPNGNVCKLTDDSVFYKGLKYTRSKALRMSLLADETAAFSFVGADLYTEVTNDVAGTLSACTDFKAKDLFEFVRRGIGREGIWEIKMVDGASGASKYGDGIAADWDTFRRAAIAAHGEDVEIVFHNNYIKITETPGVLEVWGKHFGHVQMKNGERVYKVVDLNLRAEFLAGEESYNAYKFFVLGNKATPISGEVLLEPYHIHWAPGGVECPIKFTPFNTRILGPFFNSRLYILDALPVGNLQPEHWAWKNIKIGLTVNVWTGERAETVERMLIYQIWDEFPHGCPPDMHYMTEWTEPIGPKRGVYRLAEALGTPKGTFAFVGGINAIAIGIKMASGYYNRADNERLFRDVSRLAVDASVWSVGVHLVRTAKNVGMITQASGAVTILPLAVLGAVTHIGLGYLEELLIEYDRVEELNLKATGHDILYRAWLKLIQDWKGLSHFKELGDVDALTTVNTFVTWPIAKDLYDRYLFSEEGMEADKEVQQQWYEDICLDTGEIYANMFREEILGPLYRGLCWQQSNMLGIDDEYGSPRVYRMDYYLANPDYEPVECSPIGDSTCNPFENAGPAPLGDTAAQQITNELLKGIKRLWKRWKTGDGFEPISKFFGGTPSIADITLMTIEEIKRLDAACVVNCYYYPILDLDSIGVEGYGSLQYVYKEPGILESGYWLDCRTTHFTCEEILDELLQSDLPVTVGGGTAFIFEGKGTLSAEPVYTKSAITTNSYEIPAEVTTKGVKYNWDVRGSNSVGEGERSEKGKFVAE